jgi:acyl-coenzyme A thioesterase PaaI-like protein
MSRDNFVRLIFERLAAVTESEFDRGVALQDKGDGVFAASLDAGWVVGGGVNGGYLLAVIGNAIRAALSGSGLDKLDHRGQLDDRGQVDHRDPLSVSAYYLSATRPGPAVVRTRVLRRGRSTSTVAATLSQLHDGVEVDRISTLATYADLNRSSDDVRTTLVEPVLAPLEHCIPTAEAPADFKKIAPLLDRFATRLDPGSIGWAVGKPSGNGLIQGWFRLADGRPLDSLALLMVVDALPPVTFDLGMPGWAPTLELTVHVRAKPAPGWAKVKHYTRNMAGGYFEEDCEVWDSSGRLVAQSRQLAAQPRS